MTSRRCPDCPARLVGRQRRCPRCAHRRRAAHGNYWPGRARQTDLSGRGRYGKEYDQAAAQLREQVARGRPCHFAGHPDHPQCPGRIDLTLDRRYDRWAFTTHHLVRIMDGGPAVTHAGLLAPAHRVCNSRDGLLAQNRRRSGVTQRVAQRDVTQRDGVDPVERTSEEW